MSAKKEVVEQLRSIPKQKLATKIKKSVLGVGICAFAIFGAREWAWPYYVVLPVFGIGAHVFSEELVRKAVKFMLAVVKDLIRAIRGDKGDPPDDALASGTHKALP